MSHHLHPHTHPTDSAPPTSGALIHWASHYDATVRLMALGQDRKIRRATIELAAIQPGEQVLDIGCGTGDLTLLASQQAGPSGRVCGLDASPEMIDVARHKAAGADIDFQLGLVEAMPYPDASFDLVLSSLMMHHLPGDLKRAALIEVRRVLRPGGRLLVIDMKRPETFIERLALRVLMHGRLRDGVQDLAPLMREAGLTRVETGSMKFPTLGYARAQSPKES